MYNKRVSTCLGCEVLSPDRSSFLGSAIRGFLYSIAKDRYSGDGLLVGFQPIDYYIGAAHVALFALLLHLFKNLIAEVNGKALHVGVIPLFSCSFLGVRNCQNITFFRVLSACGRCRCLPFAALRPVYIVVYCVANLFPLR